MDKTLEHLKETLEDEIKKVTKKGDITPSELESIQNAVCTIEMINRMSQGNFDGEQSMNSYGYSGRNVAYRHMPDYSGYDHRSYGDSYGDYSGRYYHDSYGYEGDSYRRGRSPVTGRYISRGHEDGYSGHSIMDRMVARLESMFDEAKTDHERQTVSEWINRLRNSN